jgi:hypothetical protein
MEVTGGYVKQMWPVLEWARSQTLSHIDTSTILKLFTFHLLAYEDGRDSVPKRRLIKFRRRGITQKKTYNLLWFLNVRPAKLPTMTSVAIGQTTVDIYSLKTLKARYVGTLNVINVLMIWWYRLNTYG